MAYLSATPAAAPGRAWRRIRPRRSRSSKGRERLAASALVTVAVVLAWIGHAHAAPVFAVPPPSGGAGQSAPAVSPTAPPPASATSAASTAAPVDAATALERVRAAYEYGDIDGVVEWSRPVAEGRVAVTIAERAHALRYLGIGLYLTGRAPGAEAAFLELLRLRPDTTLDRRTTRPDVVSFFEHVRTRHASEIRASARDSNPKIFVLNFLPPLAQIQNGHRGRAFLFGALELASAGTAIVTYTMLARDELPHHEFPNYSEAQTLKVVNIVALAVFGATYLAGVLDGLSSYSDLADDTPAARSPANGVALSLSAGGLSLTF